MLKFFILSLFFTSITSIDVLVNSNFQISYDVSNPTTFTMTIAMMTQGYIGIGFGGAMQNTEMIVGYFQNGVPKVIDFKAQNSANHPPPNQDSTQEISAVSGSRNATWTSFTFTRPYKKNGVNLFTVDNAIQMIWATAGSDSFTYHGGDRAIFSFTFSNTASLICHSNCLPGKCTGSGANQCTECASNFIRMNNLCLINNVVVPSSYIKLTKSFYVYFEYKSDNSMDFVFEYPDRGYFGVGMGKFGMNDVDMIVAQFRGNQVLITDHWSTENETPGLDINMGGSNDIVPLGWVQADGKFLSKFNRKLNTGDSKDWIITQGVHDFSYAYSDSREMNYHGFYRYNFKANISEGAQQQADIQPDPLKSSIDSHGSGLFIIWAFGVDIAVISVRYFRWTSFYLDLHIILFYLADLATLALCFILLFPYGDFVESYAESKPIFGAHLILGLVSIILMVIQHIGGTIAGLTIKSYKKNRWSESIPSLRFFHMNGGYFITILSKIALLIGYLSMGQSVVPLIIIYIIIFFLKVVLEIVYKMEPKFLASANRKNVRIVKLPDYSKVLRMLKNGTSIEAIKLKYPKLIFCFYKNNLYDLTGFLHSGGNFIMKEINGRDIGRFLAGAYGLESTKMKPHIHTAYALEALEARFIAEIESSSSFIKEKNSVPLEEKCIFDLKEKKYLNESTLVYYFNSPNYEVKNYIKGVEWIGNHFIISAPNSENKKTRLYTVIISMHEDNEVLRKSLLNYLDAKKSNDPTHEITEVIDSAKIKESGNLALVIKTYRFPKTFSQFMETSSHTKFKIEGPFGNGLGLTSKSNSHIILFAGGTGILPFLDILDYLLKKAIMTVLKNEYDDDGKNVNLFEEDYIGTFGENFKVTLYAAFSGPNDFLGKDIILPLFNITKAHGLPFFDMRIRFSRTEELDYPTTNERFNSNFCNSCIKQNENIEKIFVCGPPIMNKEIPEHFKNLGYNSEKVVLM